MRHFSDTVARHGLDEVRRHVAVNFEDATVLNSCLIVAACEGHEAVARYLVGLGADPHASMPIARASINGRLAVVRLLVGFGVSRALFDQCIWFATYHERPKVVHYLAGLAAGASGRAAEHRRAAGQAYFWWVPRCYDRGRRAGRRAARRNFRAYLRLAVI